jgi:phage/plasmid-associated DNA primase
MLQPRRDIPLVYVLTDTENGRNGKSSIKHTLCKLLGDEANSSLVLDNKTLFLADPKPGRNSHSGNEAHLEGKMLLVGDEFASELKLAADWIKEKSGGSGARCNGRHVGSKKGFSFDMRAAMLMVFNEHSMPSFGSDSVLPSRCVFIKHRTKFLEPSDFEQLNHNYKYPAVMQKGVDEMIAQNLNAVFDYAMGGDIDSVRCPPKEFTKFRDDMISEDNPLMPWFNTNFAVTNKAEDNTMQVGRIKEYIEWHGADQRVRNLKPRQLTAYFEACLHHHKLRVIRSDGDRRRVIVGLRPRTGVDLLDES